jgi:hypothetical protein
MHTVIFGARHFACAFRYFPSLGNRALMRTRCTMDLSGYSAAEIKILQEVLAAAIRDAGEGNASIPLWVIVNRLFSVAEQGERDHDRLMAAVLRVRG